MNTSLVIISYISIPLFTYIIQHFVGDSIKMYLSEKAKNTATKEDIKVITEQVETVKHEFQTRIEELKTRLSRENIEYQIKLSKYHEKRIEAIGNLYGKIEELRIYLFEMTSPAKYSYGNFEEEETERINQTGIKLNTFQKEYSEYKIFINKNVCNNIDAFIKECHNAFVDYKLNFVRKKSNNPYSEKMEKKADEAFEKIKNNFPKMIQKIEEEFRDIVQSKKQ